MKRRIFSCLAAVALLSSCATRTTNSTGLEVMTEKAFQDVTDKYTERNQSYQGLYNLMDVTATLLNSPVNRAQLEQNARLYQWDRAKFQLELNKTGERLRNETQVFLSFYTPERKNDDLHKGATQWRVYLETDGRRFEGKIAKVKLQLSEIQSVYSYHNRFATAYLVGFPVATSTVEGKPSKFTVTGPVGISVLTFKPITAADMTLNSPMGSGSPETPKNPTVPTPEH